MGFGVNACQRALLATGNDNVEEAMNWLFGHMEDAGKVQRIFERPQVD
jgi:ubiquitin carboxyl-terminal hydrolase 5/13